MIQLTPEMIKSLLPDGMYYEFMTVKHQIRVAAIDPASGTEVVIFGALNTPQDELKTIAQRKLAMAMYKAKYSDMANNSNNNKTRNHGKNFVRKTHPQSGWDV